jgi:hypothetical protein
MCFLTLAHPVPPVYTMHMHVDLHRPAPHQTSTEPTNISTFAHQAATAYHISDCREPCA